MSQAHLPASTRPHQLMWLGFAGVAVALHLLALTRYGWFRDEFYYVVCARNLAWGYVDHPPLSVALLALVRAIAGESLLALRLVAAAAGAASVYLTGRLAWQLGGGRYAQSLAALAALLAPIFLAVGRFYSMNVFDLLLWTLAASAVIGVLARPSPGGWVGLGVLVGLGLLNKISMLWFGMGLAVGLLLTSHRRHLLTPWPYAAAAVAGLLFAPHVAWQAANGWPTVEFMRNATGQKMAAVSPVEFLLDQFQVMGPANVLVYLPGLLFALLAPAAQPWRIFSLLFLAIAALLMGSGTSRANYLTVAYPPLLALGGLAWERWTERRMRLARPALLVALVVLGLPLLPMALPVLPVETFIRYQAALGMAPSTEERKSVGPLPQHYADMFGWPELAAEVAKAAARLSPDERRRAVVFGQNYGEAGAVDVLGRPLGLPRAISGHNNYWLWGFGDWDGSVMIIVGGDVARSAEHFEHVEQVGVWDHPYAMPYERGRGILIARGFKGSQRETWPQLKHYD